MRISCCLVLLTASTVSAQALPGTKPLEMKGDLAKQMLEGIDRYLTRELAASVDQRAARWKTNDSSPEAYSKSVQANRERFKKIIGVVDRRVPFTDLEFVGGPRSQSLAAETAHYTVHAVRWPVLRGVWAEGLLLEPKEKPTGAAVAIPDADWTPEQIAGLAPGVPKDSQYARRLAEDGLRVLVPTLINREDELSGSAAAGRVTNQPHREFVYRMAYQMGRHVIGYEVQKVLAAVDWLKREPGLSVSVWGYGEGGLLALYSAAVDERIVSTNVSGYFKPRTGLHDEPIYRNVWGLLREFGDAEILRLVGAPRMSRSFGVEHTREPGVKGPPPPRMGRSGAAPGGLVTAKSGDVYDEFTRFSKIVEKSGFSHSWSDRGEAGPFTEMMDPARDPSSHLRAEQRKKRTTDPQELRKGFDPQARQKRQFDQLVDFTQDLLPASTQRRQEFFWSKLDKSSVEKLKKSQEPLRDYLWKEVIGKLPEPTMPLNPRTRLIYETPKWKGYEVVLDVYDDVFAFGILLVPNGLKPGEKRPCVVCQHGLEGTPVDVVNPNEKTKYYNSFGAQLADQGFVVFAPQNPYKFFNEFRQVVRKANPLQLTLYSFIVRQHQRIIEFLKSQDFVDGARIAYYGLSYGGKVAMRIPSILLDYCLSICSGDFNEWIWKNINLEWVGSYMFSGEYEMYEFDLGNTFNYAEMAALIAPRPFMVERGHADGVGLDEFVAFEYAKVRRFYASLGLADRTEIEFFTGGHEIHLRGTLAFLRKHLNYPEK